MTTDTISAIAYSTPTMSSREIAEICDARHNDVVETIVRLFTQGVLRESRKTTRTYRPEGGGRPTEVYDLTKRDTLVVVSGYNADVRAKIIDRWLELEGRPQPRHEIPQTLGEALRLAADENDKRLAAEAKVTALTPKAAALDRISMADGSYGLYEAAKILQVGPKKFVQWLASNGWIYRHIGGKSWLARQEKINAGCLWHKVSAYTGSNGEEKVRDDVRILPKGLTKLAQVIPGAAIDPYLAPENVPPFAPTPARTA